ncbi:MAG TPA: hypothetical protein VIT91_10645 [Chthoniobacterales bacterium]
MKAIQGYHFIKPDDLSWRRSNLMKIPNASRACGMERTGSEDVEVGRAGSARLGGGGWP